MGSQCHKREVEVTTTLHRREPDMSQPHKRELVTFQPHTTTPHRREPATSHTVARPTVVKLTEVAPTPQPQPTERRLTLQATEREAILQLQATVVKLTEVAATPQLQLTERRLTPQATE